MSQYQAYGALGEWLRDETNEAKSIGQISGRPLEGDIHIMQQQIEKLLMINEALWTFIKEKHGLKDEDLIKRIAIIDMKDGKLDGKVAPEKKEVQECPKCGRKVGKHRPTCRYCGEPIVHDPFER